MSTGEDEGVVVRSQKLIKKREDFVRASRIERDMKQAREDEEEMRKRSFYHASPFKVSNQQPIWDEDGKLIVYEVKKREEEEEKHEEEWKPVKRKYDPTDFLTRNANFEKPKETPKSRRRHKKLSKVSQAFIKRQEEAAEKKKLGVEPEKTPRKVFMSAKSKQIVAKGPREKARTPIAEVNYSFRPDIGSSRHYKACGIPITCAEAHLVMKNIEQQTLKLEKRAREMQECTFRPHMFRSPVQRDKLAMRRRAQEGEGFE